MTDRERLASEGFSGFISFRELRNSGLREVPNLPGVYVVLYEQRESPAFLSLGTGGYFKGRDPNVPVGKLEAAWVPETAVIYIGKAGGQKHSATLRTRLRAYLEFGAGKAVGHWGGRYIWQIPNAENLIICWRPLVSDEPKEVEHKMLTEFEQQHERLPFANLQR